MNALEKSSSETTLGIIYNSAKKNFVLHDSLGIMQFFLIYYSVEEL